MKAFFKAIFFILTIAYPFIIFFGRQYVSPLILSLVLLAMLVIRAYFLGFKHKTARYWILGGLLIVILTYVFDTDDLLLWYPAIVNLILLTVFARSLSSPMSAIERIARLQDPDLPPFAVTYTRKVTQVWCGFFIINGSIAAATAWYGNDQIWTIYNGVIAYTMMGILFAVEWLYRQHYRAKHADA